MPSVKPVRRPTTAAPQESPDLAVDVRGLSVDLPGADGPVPVLRDVDLVVGRGETVAIVGESGSGKSMTLRALTRLLPDGAAVTGRVHVDGVDVNGLRGRALRSYRRDRVGTIFQDPRSAINPVQRISDFLVEAVRDSGGDVAGARDRARHLLERMGITDPDRRMEQHPYELSGGLLQRVMIASVLLAEPDLVLADEPTTALDVTTQSDVLAITAGLRAERGTSMVFVTHDLDLALAICDRVVVLYAGRVLEVADAAGLRESARHPYTRGLLASRPPLATRLTVLPVIDGAPVSAAASGTGCPFVSRCPIRIERCSDELPELTSTTTPDGIRQGLVRCHRHAESATLWPTAASAGPVGGEGRV